MFPLPRRMKELGSVELIILFPLRFWGAEEANRMQLMVVQKVEASHTCMLSFAYNLILSKSMCTGASRSVRSEVAILLHIDLRRGRLQLYWIPWWPEPCVEELVIGIRSDITI